MHEPRLDDREGVGVGDLREDVKKAYALNNFDEFDESAAILIIRGDLTNLVFGFAEDSPNVIRTIMITVSGDEPSE